jgi:hypothetical protein
MVPAQSTIISKRGSMVGGVAALLPSRRQRLRRPPPLLALVRDVLIERRYSRGQMLSARLHKRRYPRLPDFPCSENLSGCTTL